MKGTSCVRLGSFHARIVPSMCFATMMVLSVKVPLSQPCFDHFFGPCFRAMMKQVCWHSRRSKAYRGLPEARGQSEAHGDSNLYTMGVRPCVTAKLPVLGGWFWNLILLNLAAASCYLHGGRFWRQQVPSPFMAEKSIAGSGARAEPLQAAAQSVATGISTVLLWLADAIRHCFLMLALLRPSRRTRQNRNRQQSAASGC